MEKQVTKKQMAEWASKLPKQGEDSIRILIKGDIEKTFNNAKQQAIEDGITMTGTLQSGTVARLLVYGTYTVSGKIIQFDILKRPPLTMWKIRRKLNTFFSKTYK